MRWRTPAPDLPRRALPRARRTLPPPLLERQHELTLFPGALEMLHALKVAQPTASRWPPARRAAVWTTRCRRCRLKTLFDATRTADETASKPDPRMLLELMAECGTTPERT